uniref:Uncharacterized protein n=1 Tax=Fagus sylvatica TaxID=28930 RepID=A0A2N9HM68_FAGSY
MPPSGLLQATLPPNMASMRPTGPPIGQPSPFASKPSPMGGNVVPPAYGAPPPDAFPSSGPVGFAPPPGARPISASPHLTTGPAMPRSSAPSGFVSNGPPAFTSGVLSGGPRFPSAGGAPQPPVGPPSAMGLGGAAPQAPSMRSLLGSPAVGAPPGAPVQPAPPFSASAQGVSSPPGSYGPPRWPMQARQVCNEYLSLCILFTF